MRILITSIVDLNKTAHNRLHQFVKHLSQNHEVTVLSINDWWKASQTNIELYAQGFEDILHNINLIYFTQRRVSPILQEVASVITLGKILYEIDYKGFDVHLNYNTLISGYFVARKMKAAGIETIYDIADHLPAMIRTSPQIPLPLRPLGGIVGDIMLRRNTEIANRVTLVTESLRKSLKVPPSKSQVIPNGVDIELFQDRPSPQLRKELGLGESFVLGFVGTLREWVDFEPVFAALNELNSDGYNIRILIVGEEGGLDKNKALAQRYGISDRVVFTGTVPYPQVPEYTSCMDVCLMPLKYRDAQPLSFLQYLACGKPVISTKSLEVSPELAVYAPDKEEYRRQIIRLLSNTELQKEMGLKGRKYVEQSHSWDKIGRNLEGILNKASRGDKLK